MARRIVRRTSLMGYLTLLLCIAGTAQARVVDLPPGWFLAGQQPGAYDAGLDHAETHDGKSSGFIRANTERPLGFGTLMQLFEASAFKGQRARMSAFVKTSEVADWAGMWMRIDTAAGEVAFDNMQGRPLTGTADWRLCEIVLDVPASATRIALGLILNGRSTAWMANLKLEPVPENVPTTDLLARKAAPLATAANLGFEGHGHISGAVNYGYEVTFDDAHVVGAGTNVVRRDDGTWAGELSGFALSLTERDGHLDGAEVHLTETREKDRLEVGGLWFGDRVLMTFQPKAISIRVLAPSPELTLAAPPLYENGAMLSSQLDLVYSEPGIYQNASLPSMKVGVFGDAARADPPVPQTVLAFLALIEFPSGSNGVRQRFDAHRPGLLHRAPHDQLTRRETGKERTHHAVPRGGVLTATPHLPVPIAGQSGTAAPGHGATPSKPGAPGAVQGTAHTVGSGGVGSSHGEGETHAVFRVEEDGIAAPWPKLRFGEDACDDEAYRALDATSRLALHPAWYAQIHMTLPFRLGPEWDALREAPILYAVAAVTVGLSADPPVAPMFQSLSGD